MKQRKLRIPGPIRDFFRLASAQDLLAGAGRMMMRRSPRAMLWTAGITSSGYLSNSLGLPGFSAMQAVLLPFIIGGGMFGIGASIRYIPRTLSRKLTTIAAANDLNLMEDYRKSQVLEHLDVLWDRVFWYESAIRYSRQDRLDEHEQIAADRDYLRQVVSGLDDGLRERLGVRGQADVDDLLLAIMTCRPLTDKMEKSRAGFIISSVFALSRAMPQSSQADCIGYSLDLFEDERDGAYFDPSDNKLLEQYVGNSTLSDIKTAVGFGKLDALREIPATLTRRFWFFLITRKVATVTGRAIRELNEQFRTDRFNSQVLLWPGEEEAEWVKQLDGATESVLRWRKAIVRSALGPTYRNAMVVLDRMSLPAVRLATALRLRYDPQYCDRSLDYVCEDDEREITNNIFDDVQWLGYRASAISRICRRAEAAADELADFMAFLGEKAAEVMPQEQTNLRAVKIAFHTDREGIRKRFRTEKGCLGADEVKSWIGEVLADEKVYCEHLVCLRLHQQLAMLQRRGYRDLARKLAYADGD